VVKNCFFKRTRVLEDVLKKKKEALTAVRQKKHSGSSARDRGGVYTAAAFGGNATACLEACRANKLTQVRGLMAQINAVRYASRLCKNSKPKK
jgi:hypothetical protein